jgi:hypothetical protein
MLITPRKKATFHHNKRIHWKYLHKHEIICAESISIKTLDQGHILWVESESFIPEISEIKKKLFPSVWQNVVIKENLILKDQLHQ